MIYDSMGIILTNKCDAVCEHCCFSCSPKSNLTMPREMVFRCIEQSKEIAAINQIGFSGGEAFLIFDDLLEYVEAVHKTNRTSTVMTNGQWASSYELAYTRLKKLKDAGLVGIGISYDEFHQKYVSPEKIANVIRAAKSLGLSTKLQGAVIQGSRLGNAIDDLMPDVLDLQFSVFACYPVGRAKNTIADNQYIRNTSPRHRFCRKASTFSIDVSGNVWPCCVPVVRESDLSVGNIYQDELVKIYANLQNNIFLKLLRNHGFDFFLDIAEKELKLDIPDRVISSCELCSYLFSSSNIYRFLPYLRKRYKEV